MVAAVLSSSCVCSYATQFQTGDPCYVTGMSACRIQAVCTHSRQQYKQACVLCQMPAVEAAAQVSRCKQSCFPAISASSCGCQWPQRRLFSKGQEMHLEWKNSCWIVLLPPTKLDQVTRACIAERSPRPTSRTSSEGLLAKY